MSKHFISGFSVASEDDRGGSGNGNELWNMYRSFAPRRKRFCIDTEVRCVGTHPPIWPFEPARVKPN